jgi:hypothetical protein
MVSSQYKNEAHGCPSHVAYVLVTQIYISSALNIVDGISKQFFMFFCVKGLLVATLQTRFQNFRNLSLIMFLRKLIKAEVTFH